MRRHSISILLASLSLVPWAASSSADDGVVLIDHAAVMASGGFPYKISQPGSYR
jgi:hypothetical protein